MARNCGDERRENSNSEVLEEEEEEALSLCDLPVSLINEEIQSTNEEKQPKSLQTQEDFDFCSWGGSVLTESEMCAADEVFFQGQILPLRLSVSSDSAVNTGSRSLNISRSNSRSESMDHRYYSSVFSSINSRSSSIGSRHSSSSTSTTNTTTTTTKYKPKQRNQFHTHPSPKPQIRISALQHRNACSRSRQSTLWDFFRLGLVRTPEIELQDLKLRTNIINPSTNKSFGSQNSNSSSNSGSFSKIIQASNDGDKSNYDLKIKKKRKQRFFAADSAFLSGCKCSSGAVETVSSKIVIIKSGNGTSTRSSSHNEKEKHAIKEKLQQMTKENRQQQQQHQQGKQAVSRHRTFEWLKELSLEAQLDEA